jgi:predicted RNase H-like HicB family nuclease
MGHSRGLLARPPPGGETDGWQGKCRQQEDRVIQGPDVSRYTYRVNWSVEDGQFVATCAEFPSLSWLADSQAALQGLVDVVADLVSEGESVPEPLSERSYSGKSNLCIGEGLHAAWPSKPPKSTSASTSTSSSVSPPPHSHSFDRRRRELHRALAEDRPRGAGVSLAGSDSAVQAPLEVVRPAGTRLSRSRRQCRIRLRCSSRTRRAARR